MADPQTTQQPRPAQAPAAKRKILVVNNTDSTYRIPIMDSGSGKDPRPTTAAVIVLLPGANAVDPDEWDLVAEYPIVEILCRKKQRGGFEVGDPRVDVRTLDSFKDEDEAKELVDATVDGDLLRSWLRAEKRPAIVTALEEQLEKIDPRRDREGSADEDQE
jgi:hypothetical protein